MNILFYTPYKVSPTNGGTERTTITVATALKDNYGCHCFSLYSVYAETAKEDCFEEEFFWSNRENKETVCEFVNKHHIDWIVNQGSFFEAEAFKDISLKTGCKIVFAHHFEPGWEERLFNYGKLISEIKRRKRDRSRFRVAIDIIFFPLMRLRYRLIMRKRYLRVYDLSEKVVLLSKGYIPLYAKYGRINEHNKFVVIPNGLTCREQFPVDGIKKKKDIALIVSRLDEEQKRISLALKIWKEIKKHRESAGWSLKIVGHGSDKEMYLSLIEEKRIPDVQLLGRKDSMPYYKEASIFLMTSKSEGQPLTLNEALQFGVVPIIFHSFASLRDIIKDGEDGFIIPECDVRMYVKRLLELIRDQERRRIMATKAISNSIRFSQEGIGIRWWNLFVGV